MAARDLRKRSNEQADTALTLVDIVELSAS